MSEAPSELAPLESVPEVALGSTIWHPSSFPLSLCLVVETQGILYTRIPVSQDSQGWQAFLLALSIERFSKKNQGLIFALPWHKPMEKVAMVLANASGTPR